MFIYGGVNTLSKLKLESKLKKQTDFGDVSRINTLSKLIFQNNTLSKPKILALPMLYQLGRIL